MAVLEALEREQPVTEVLRHSAASPPASRPAARRHVPPTLLGQPAIGCAPHVPTGVVAQEGLHVDQPSRTPTQIHASPLLGGISEDFWADYATGRGDRNLKWGDRCATGSPGGIVKLSCGWRSRPMTSQPPSYRGYRFPPEIISHAVWLYHRFSLSFRDVEDLLAERGITVTYEAIRQWCWTFGLDYARRLRHRRGRQGDTWHLGRAVRQDPGAATVSVAGRG